MPVLPLLPLLETERGTVIWDDSFSATSKAAHLFFSQTCEALAAESCTAKGCMDGSGLLTRRSEGVPLVQCFMWDWRAWLCEEPARASAYPSCGANQMATCDIHTGNCAQWVDGQCDQWITAPSVTGCLAAAGCHWQHECKAMADIEELPTGSVYVQSLATYRAQEQDVQRRVGILGGALKFLTVRFTSTLEEDQPQDSVVEIETSIKDFVTARNTVAPAGLRSAFHSSASGDFAWASTQQGLVDNVFFGFKVVFPAAFFTLLCATKNIVVRTDNPTCTHSVCR